MLESLWEIYRIAEVGRDATWYTHLLLGLQSLALVLGESWTVKMSTFLHCLHFPLIFIEIIDIPTTNGRLLRYLHRRDNIVMKYPAYFLLLFVTNIIRMQMETILKTRLWGEAKWPFLWIFSIILLGSEERGIMVWILSGEGMILDDGRREDNYIFLVLHQIALVLIMTCLPRPSRVDKRSSLMQFVRWRFVALSMIDLLPRLVHLD